MSQNKEYQKYLEYKRQNTAEGNIPSPSYANIMADEDNEQSYIAYQLNKKKEVILLLKEKDSKWSNEPWTLMKRYMGDQSYPSRTYKTRIYYENILKNTGWEFKHFSHATQPEVYNFSKITIKRVISLQNGGISPLSTKEFYFPQNQNPAKYNFWDAFQKVLLYENKGKKHSWFIKICSEVYKSDIPTWFIKWWQHFGTTEEILPKYFKEKFSKWRDYIHSYFLFEFFIPYIWR